MDSVGSGACSTTLSWSRTSAPQNTHGSKAGLTFGSTAEQVLKFNADVKKLFRKIQDHAGVPCGYLYVDEFGYKNNNLHCHGLLLSPYIPQQLISKWWSEIRDDGSYRAIIAVASSFEAGLRHALEYTGKYVADTPERAFQLELALHGCKRVQTLALFFNRVSDDIEDERPVPCCCGVAGCVLVPRHDLGWLPVAHFERQGIAELEDRSCRSPGKRVLS